MNGITQQKGTRFPSRQEIRQTMELTGLPAYEAFQKLCTVSKYYCVDYDSVIRGRLWKEYNAASFSDNKNALTSEKLPEEPIHVDSVATLLRKNEFDAYFYSPDQQTALKQIRHREFSLDTLALFLEVELPDLLAIEQENLVCSQFAFISSQIIPNKSIFFYCGQHVTPETIIQKKPICIIGYHKYQSLFINSGIPFISRRFLKSYLFELSEAWRQNFAATTIGISGSVGKTTTTDMITNVAGSSFNVFKAAGNQNTEYQIASFVYYLRDNTEVWVQEGSGSFPGQLEASAHIIRPNIYVLTNVGNSHIEKYEGSQARLLYGKLALDRQASPDGIGVINWDDPLLSTAPYNHRILSYGIKNPKADLTAVDIIEKDGIISFAVMENCNDGEKTPVHLNISGEHNIYNALAGFAVGLLLKIPRETIVRALAEYRPSGVRQNLVRRSGQQLFLDCYNASLESMEAALKTMNTINSLKETKRVIVFGDILELGEKSQVIHQQLGNVIVRLNTADIIYFYGKDIRYTYEIVRDANIPCRFTEDMLTLERWLATETHAGDLIVFKASHGVNLHLILDDLYGTDYYFYDDAVLNKTLYRNGLQGLYRCVDHYGCGFSRYTAEETDLYLPSEFSGLPVRLIAKAAFSGTGLVRISLPDQLSCISERAFFKCVELTHVLFPASLRYIGRQAFEGCAKLKTLDLSRGCSTIDHRAFAVCKRLRSVILPENLLTISDDAFDSDTRAVFHCPEGSYAERWVKEHGFRLASSFRKTYYHRFLKQFKPESK